ncbi:MAG TPA: hypothetical protein VN632_07605 [Stellaceae bacterium]|nr:hypothetical protein [Stellaceae bacterium]
MAPVYFLLHVPKTAGKSIQHHLIARCAPGVFWRPRGASDLSLALGRPYRSEDMPPPDRLGAVAGHFLGRSLEHYFPGRDIRRVVLLRDPVGLQVSLYNFRMIRALARGRGTYSFDLHLAALPRDFVTHYLLSRWLEISWPRLFAMPDTRKYALVNDALRQFWFVGAYTECDRVMAAIADDLGVPPVAPRVNRTAVLRDKVGWRALTADDLTAPQRRAIEAQHPIDLALWRSWRGAGFNPAAVTPAPLPPARAGFRAHEIARPAYEITRLARRRWG